MRLAILRDRTGRDVTDEFPSVLTYQEVRQRLPETKHLLIGNGFSVACNQVFSYPNLFERAKEKGLSAEAAQVFRVMGTNNFEGVMRQMDYTRMILDIYGGGSQVAVLKRRLRRDLQSIKASLVESIAMSHLAHPSMIPQPRRLACVSFLKEYANIFTTNYDLLTYWVTREAAEVAKVNFHDGFRAPEDEPNAEHLVFSERIGRNRGVLFLHGALHLYFEGGETRKHSWKRSGKRITELVGQGLSERRYPLFVAEGDAETKLAQIHGNDYLSYCLGRFEGIENPLVIFGHSLAASDQHIVDAIVSAPKLGHVFCGLFGDPENAENRKIHLAANAMASRRKKLKTKDRRFVDLAVEFYSSESAKPWG